MAVERQDAVHLRVQQNVNEHLNLREFLSKQRRHGCARHCPGELVEPELKFVRQFDIVRARPVLCCEGSLAQTRLEFVRRKSPAPAPFRLLARL